MSSKGLLTALSVLCFFGVSKLAFAAAGDPIATDADLPAPKVIGAPTIWVHQVAGQPGTVVFANGAVVTKTMGGLPLTVPLAYAMNNAHPGDVIACSGELAGVEIGKYNPNKPFAVYWPNGAVVRDISIVSEDPAHPCIIRDTGIMGNYMIPGSSGVDDLTFKDIIFKNTADSGTAFIVFGGSIHGMLRFYNVGFASVDPTAYSGYGLKWNIRANGRARYDIRGMDLKGAQEHGLYLDSPGADGAGDSYFLDIRQNAPTGRTGIQIVNRAYASAAGGPTGLGDLYFRRLNLWTMAGGGGSGLTVVGHLGTVFVDTLFYKGNLGAVVFWSDSGKGLHLDSKGFTTTAAVLENIHVDSPNADRSHIAIKGVGYTKIRRFFVKGNKVAVDLDSPSGGPVYNGVVEFQTTGALSKWNGFKSYIKVKKNGQTLSNTQIDTIWP